MRSPYLSSDFYCDGAISNALCVALPQYPRRTYVRTTPQKCPADAFIEESFGIS
jgi:hypothetical protein